MDHQGRSMHTHSLCALILLSNLENLTLGRSLALLQQEQRDFESGRPSLLPASLFSHVKCEDNYWPRSCFFTVSFLHAKFPACPLSKASLKIPARVKMLGSIGSYSSNHISAASSSDPFSFQQH